MGKSFYGYQLGANIKQKERGEDVNIVPDNKTLMALALNGEPDDDASPVRLKNMKEIFEHYKPSVEVDLKNIDGEAEEKELKFNSLKDFTKDGIVAQSTVLQGLQDQETIYAKYIDVLQNNDKLKTVIADPELKKEFLEMVKLLIDELEESKG